MNAVGWRPRAIRLTLALATLLWFGTTHAQSTVVREVPTVAAGWRMQGEGEMRWFGLLIYSARLWAPEGKPVPVTTTGVPPANHSFALELTYARQIAGTRLVDTSIDELKRLGERDDARLQRWRDALSLVFPDVQEGERIIGLREPNGGAQFYHQGKLTGRLDDPELASAFFGIWLDARTRDPVLRARLLGSG